MSAVRSKRLGARADPEHRLVARICSSKFSYFISIRDPGPGDQLIDDEAVIEIDAEISEIEPSQTQHLAQRLSCSIVCARTFSRAPPQKSGGHPLFLSVNLKKNNRSTLAYLPGDAFWTIQSRLEAGTLSFLEASYEKPTRGSGDLRSLHFF